MNIGGCPFVTWEFSVVNVGCLLLRMSIHNQQNSTPQIIQPLLQKTNGNIVLGSNTQIIHARASAICENQASDSG